MGTKFKKRNLLLFFLLAISVIFIVRATFASNPSSPISPSDNIQDPGDPGTSWGGCIPSDSNCYVTTGGVTGVNIYTTDGTLNGNRIVDLGGNTLDFQQDTASFLKIDPTLNSENIALYANVGVGVTPTPAQLFIVHGAINGSSTNLFYINKTSYETFLQATDATGVSALYLSGNGDGSNWNLNAHNGSGGVASINGSSEISEINLSALGGINMNGNISINGNLKFTNAFLPDNTNTPAGTTGNQTIDKPAGTVNIAGGGTTVTVTNSLCTTSSTVYAVIRTNDTTAVIKNVVPGLGSFTINLATSTTSEVSIGFLVVN